VGREGHQEVAGEAGDARKAAGWSLLAGIAHGGVLLADASAFRGALVALAYGLMLPPIAVLHVRHSLARQSGAVLATIAGTAAVVVGIGASVDGALLPSALLVLGMWWWTIGKMWVEIRISRALGGVTAALGVLALAGAFATSLAGVDARSISAPMHALLAVWLVLLSGALLALASRVPSR
jgi:hypothetical protein